MTLPATYALLGFAIVLEVIGTSMLGASRQFTRPLPTIALVLCYGAAFYCLSLTVKVLPVGIVYAIWSGMGIVLIAVIGFAVFGQKLDLAAVIGLGLIVSGVVVVNLFSDSVSH